VILTAGATPSVTRARAGLFYACEVRACTAPIISTTVRVETRLLSVVLEGLCVHLCARDAGVVCACEVGCEIWSDRW